MQNSVFVNQKGINQKKNITLRKCLSWHGNAIQEKDLIKKKKKIKF